MKAIVATFTLVFVAGVCLAGDPQPTQRRNTSNVTDILTFNNITNMKPRCVNGPKIYAHVQENNTTTINNLPPATTPPPTSNNNQTFTPTPLVNYYKEFR